MLTLEDVLPDSLIGLMGEALIDPETGEILSDDTLSQADIDEALEAAYIRVASERKTRPSKFTERTVTRLLDELSKGTSVNSACAIANIGVQTYYDWYEKHPEFVAAVEMANAEAEKWHLSQIRKASKQGQWTASAWWLERRKPAQYARRQQVHHTGLQTGAAPKVAVVYIRGTALGRGTAIIEGSAENEVRQLTSGIDPDQDLESEIFDDD